MLAAAHATDSSPAMVALSVCTLAACVLAACALAASAACARAASAAAAKPVAGIGRGRIGKGRSRGGPRLAKLSSPCWTPTMGTLYGVSLCCAGGGASTPVKRQRIRGTDV